MLEVFRTAGWLQYFERLQGHDDYVALDFARNLEGNHSEVRGVPIEFSEQAIAEVTTCCDEVPDGLESRKESCKLSSYLYKGRKCCNKKDMELPELHCLHLGIQSPLVFKNL